jgi:hypothetical protein
MKNTSNEKNRFSSQSACSFPCYRLISVNELARKSMNIYKIKKEKKFPVISGVSGQFPQNAVFGLQNILFRTNRDKCPPLIRASISSMFNHYAGAVANGGIPKFSNSQILKFEFTSSHSLFLHPNFNKT